MSGSRFTIDAMTLHLPAGFEHRAGAIARAVADALGNVPIESALRLEQLTLPALSVDPNASDAMIGGDIARAIHGQLVRHASGTGGKSC